MDNVNLFLVFIEGIVSFFSPCILPLLPVYLGILSNSSMELLKEGKVSFWNSKLMRNTLLFILGISTTFFILGSSVNMFSRFFNSNKTQITLIGGIIIIIMGLFYMGYLNLSFLQKEKKFNFEVKDMNAITAYLFGFTFSFGWTPCIGPMLASVLIMTSNSKTLLEGNLLIGLYTLGFVLPFIIIAMFYNKLFKIVDKIKLHMPKIKKIGGIILIISGIIMISGAFNGKINDENLSQTQENNMDKKINKNKDSDKEKISAIDFSLYDQYGNLHKLSDYKGKVIFLNFWATWCPPCKEEMPYIESIYKYYNQNKEDVVILGVVSPDLGREMSKDGIKDFLKDNNYTFPVVFDNTARLTYEYNINAFPSTLIIDKEGNINQYVSGAMNEFKMKSLIEKVK